MAKAVRVHKVGGPEALVYEPVGNTRTLVGVEYIVDAASWLMYHENTPPALEGQDFQFVDAPNRFNLKPFFELHVWAWRPIFFCSARGMQVLLAPT